MAVVMSSEPNCLGELVTGFLRSQRGQRLKNKQQTKKKQLKKQTAPPNFQGLNCALHSWPVAFVHVS